MTLERLSKQIDFIIETDKLKQVIRQTALTDASRQENVAEHSWHISLMALLLAEYSKSAIDVLKVLKMLLIHDLVEIDAGDTFLYDEDKNNDKSERERVAAKRIFGMLPDDQAANYISLWREFEEEVTPESRFAKAVDAMHPVLLCYYNRGWSWKKHNLSMSTVIEKKAHIRDGSQELWELTKKLLHRAQDLGYFPQLDEKTR